jgi:hypothetical protein
MPQLDSSSILDTLARLQSAPPSVFGAGAHGFRLNPPLTEARVLEFEEAHGITLPSDFREFLIAVGNGGAGPFYGLFPLGQMDDNFAMRDWRENDATVGDLSQPFRFQAAWNNLTGKPEDGFVDLDESDYWRRMDAFERTYWGAELMNGAIPICHEGCALRIWLVVTGPQRGFLWEDQRSEFGGVQPVRLADGSPAKFISWYEEWLNRCLLVEG